MLKKSQLIVLLLLTTSSYLFAQKTSDIQTGSLLVSNIKVDGNANDWNSPLQAANKNTGLSYTIANDAQKLYVVMRAKNLNDVRKIMLGGITFSMNQDGKKKTISALSLTYPVVTRESLRSAFSGSGQRGSSGLSTTQQQRDSIQLSRAQAQLQKAKDIKVFGFNTVTDSLISIYNEYSIKVATNLTNEGLYIYELAIPLTLIPLNLDKEFGYNVKVNGLHMNLPTRVNSPSSGRGGNFGDGGDFQAYFTPTDFWGKYTLAK